MRIPFRILGAGSRQSTWLVVVTGLLHTGSGMGTAPALAQRPESQAIPGHPFGVASVTFPGTEATSPADYPLWLEESEGRAHYPVLSSGGLLRQLVGDEGNLAGSGAKTAYFLFTGDAPLQLTLRTPAPVRITLRPGTQPPRMYDRLLQRWWREYHQAAGDLARRGDYPPLIQNYLLGMLGQRLGLRPPLLVRLRQDDASAGRQIVDLLLGTERLHDVTLRETMASSRESAPADQPIPLEVSWRPPVIPPGPKPELEALASHTPEECFYVRFGSFENYMWLEDLLTSYGGDIGRMVTARGQDAKSGDRIRRQLSMPQSALAKLFGGTLIQDVALIGRDMFLEDGATIGVLLHARNSALLSVSINQQRNATLTAEKAAGAGLETLQVGGRDVTLLSTPDNGVRSFYAIDGDFHLVTTSRHLVERFLEAGQGKRALADSPEFQHARTVMPLGRHDTMFAFLSTPFLSGLFSPQYQIELPRRLQALVDLEIVRLAQLAAEAERLPAASVDDLIAGGFLPAGFGRQVDGSGPILESARTIDSLRGARGTFLPIADVELTRATAAEVARYNLKALNFFEPWRQLDPVMVAVRREKLADKRERITFDANISPFAEEKYGRILSLLGPPVTQRVVPRAGDVVSAQAFVTGGKFSAIVPPHLLFVGVQDMEMPADLNGKGLLQWLRLLRATPGYLGAWPKPGFLDWLPLRGDTNPPEGLSRLLFEVWRWQADEFSVLSFQREVLHSVAPQLLIAQADDPAQLRIQIGDLESSRLRDGVNQLYFQRARQVSQANTHLLHTLTQQLRVAPEQTLGVAESLLNTQLICPLGGKYELGPSRLGQSSWRSTAWSTAEPDAMPATYRAPLLQWFRGLELSLSKSENQITVRSWLELDRSSRRE